jgi:hypothetical protein
MDASRGEIGIEMLFEGHAQSGVERLSTGRSQIPLCPDRFGGWVCAAKSAHNYLPLNRVAFPLAALAAPATGAFALDESGGRPFAEIARGRLRHALHSGNRRRRRGRFDLAGFERRIHQRTR